MFDRSMFPSRAGLIPARRAPLYFRPINGSNEQLVVGVLVLGPQGIHLERANRLDRLVCFYGNSSVGVISAIELSLDDLEDSFDELESDGFKSFRPLSSGLWIGELEPAEGASLKGIGAAWMRSMSSLYAEDSTALVVEAASSVLQTVNIDEPAQSRLGNLLLSYIEKRNPVVASAFSSDIRNQRRANRAHGVIIDFSGHKVVANFGVISVSQYTRSIDSIKRRMWDLKVSENRESSALLRRNHELLAQHPAFDDPQLTIKQADKVMDGLKELETEADQLEIRFMPMTTVQAIGDHILDLEAA